MFSPAQIRRAHARAHGATDTRARTIDPARAQRFRDLTAGELAEARDEVLERLDSDDATQDDADDADALTAEIEARQRVAQRRARLAQGLRDGSLTPHPTGGQRPVLDEHGRAITDEAPGLGAELVGSAGWRAFAANGYAGRSSIDVPNARALIATNTPAG